METKNLSPEQLRKLLDSIASKASYIARVKERLEELDFSADDQLFQRVLAAHVAMQSLNTYLRYNASDNPSDPPW